MNSKRRFRAGVFAGTAVAALAAVLGLWRTGVLAELDLSDAIHVEIEDPEGIELIVYSPGANIPGTLPIGVFSEVRPEITRGDLGVDDITSVETVLGGELNGDTGEITGELDSDDATLVNEEGDVSNYVAVVDLADLDFGTAIRGSDKFASDVIRTVAIASGYYSSRDVAGIVEGDSINVEVTIADAGGIDGDGNGIPDAASLADDEDFVLIGEDGTITLVTVLNILIGRGESEVEVTHSYDTAAGPVQVTVVAPTLDALQLADDFFDDFNTARLITSISGDSEDLVDEPFTANPELEFDLVDGTDPLPAPRNVFVRTAIAVASIKVRGTSSIDWTFVDELPGGLEFVGTLSGPGVAAALENGTDVGAYTYGVTLTQDGEDIIAEAGNDAQTEAWAEVETLSVNNEDSADDDADARIDQADDGDDTVRATFTIGSAIFGSNVTPRAGGSSDSDGSSFCFIATAAYGTPMAAEIQSLRDVRDGYLVSSAIGAAFVDAYYRISPPVADVVAQSSAMKQGVRIVLAPVVTVSRWFVAAPGLVAIAIAAMAILGMMATGRFFRPYGTRVRK